MDNNSNPSSGGNPLKEMYDEWTFKTPFITRNSLICIIAIYILSFFISVTSIFGNIPYFSLYHYEIYRLFLSSLVGNSILTLLMICLFYPAMGGRLENSMGSAGYLSLLSIFGLLINVTFLFLCFFLSLFGMPEALFWECSGFWTILFGLIVVECMQMPDVPRRILCLPIDIPSKYFPVVLYLFFSLLSGPELSYALGMGIGYLYTIGKLDSIKPSTQRLQHIETAGFLSSLSRYTGWIPVGSALGVSVYTGDGPTSRDPESGGNEDRSSGGGGGGAGAGTIWRTGKQTQSTGAPTAPTNQAMHAQDSFPGSGRTLATTSGGGVIGSLWSGNSTVSSESKTDRASMAARRLAALGRSGESLQPSAPPLDQYVAGVAAAPTTSPSNLRALLDMGFTHRDATAALQRSNDNLEAALTILSGN